MKPSLMLLQPLVTCCKYQRDVSFSDYFIRMFRLLKVPSHCDFGLSETKVVDRERNCPEQCCYISLWLQTNQPQYDTK